MQFGKTPHPENINFTLPEDHPHTKTVFNKSAIGKTKFYIGCAKWNKQDLKGFYPRGTKDELKYYSSQFNSIELNATYYKLYPPEQFATWFAKTPNHFKFYPKITQDISHYHRLDKASYPITEMFLNNIATLHEKLGSVFLQMHEEFHPSEFHLLENFINAWPSSVPLAVELRHQQWFQNPNVTNKLYQLYTKNNISNIITDTAGRRDLLHMSLTSPHVFIRFVGANHPTDYQRLDDWILKIQSWYNQGIKSISFFVHQNTEIESVQLSAYFIKKLNQLFNLQLKVPLTVQDIQNQQQSLF